MPGITDEMREKWRHQVTFCKDRPASLNDWMLDFIDSLDAQLNAGRDLTIKQSFKLGEIYHEVEAG